MPTSKEAYSSQEIESGEWMYRKKGSVAVPYCLDTNSGIAQVLVGYHRENNRKDVSIPEGAIGLLSETLGESDITCADTLSRVFDEELGVPDLSNLNAHVKLGTEHISLKYPSQGIYADVFPIKLPQLYQFQPKDTKELIELAWMDINSILIPTNGTILRPDIDPRIFLKQLIKKGVFNPTGLWVPVKTADDIVLLNGTRPPITIWTP